MEKEHRKAIQRNFVALVETCNYHALLPLLIEKGVFTKDMIKWQNENDEKDKKRQLFINITRRGPEAFHKLITALRESYQHSLADCLDPRDTPEQSVSDNSSTRLFLYPNNGNIKQSIENAKEFEDSFYINLRTEPLKVVVKLAEKFVNSYNDIANMPPMYQTQSKNRGIALIINIVNYSDEARYPFRYGAYVDDANLIELFSQMGLKVLSFRDLNRMDLENKITSFAHDPLLSHADIAVIVVMGHGSYQLNDTTVIGADGNEVEATWIEEQFNNYNCSYMKMKPKIFIYQVCRGPLNDYGTSHSVPRRTEHDSSVKSIRTYSDMLIAHSTLSGFASHRDTNTGSWYIELICEIFMKYSYNTEVQDLLTMVDNRLKKMRSEKMTQQTSTFTNIGFNKCYFHPGIYLEDGLIKKFNV
ncbi:caspase Dronc-like [Agrilus planipennis]|uniref:Caspase Dronc-like n=1 Tax=Agrilus planipennis TaxID=224129 RepID=A0A1W4WWI8_AGRPL|nr:caspase Dronc-like [Agrilus planipennis]